MKKRKHFLNLVTFAVAAVLTCGVTSCGDDDDDNGNPFGSSSSSTSTSTSGVSYIPSPVITDINGNMLRVMSAGSLRFTYSESGKLASISFGHHTYALQGDKFSLGYNDQHWDIYLNSEGLIATIHYTDGSDPSGKTDEYEEKTTNYSYSNHRLKSCSFSCETQEGRSSESYTDNGKISYTWKDGNLIGAKYERKTIGKDEEGSFMESYTYTTTFTYGTQSNPCKQFPLGMGGYNYDITGGDKIEDVFCVLGLLGYGPSYLPTGYTQTIVESVDGEVDKNRTYNYRLSFTLNDNGTFKSESRDGSNIDYTYSNASSN